MLIQFGDIKVYDSSDRVLEFQTFNSCSVNGLTGWSEFIFLICFMVIKTIFQLISESNYNSREIKHLGSSWPQVTGCLAYFVTIRLIFAISGSCLFLAFTNIWSSMSKLGKNGPPINIFFISWNIFLRLSSTSFHKTNVFLCCSFFRNYLQPACTWFVHTKMILICTKITF